MTNTEWQSRCESGSCVQTREVRVDVVEVRSSRNPAVTVEFTAAEWEAHEAALRAEGWAAAGAALREARFGGYGDVAANYLEALAAASDAQTTGGTDDE